MNAAHRSVDALSVEVRAFTDLIDDVAGADWDTPTPAPGWSVRHQVAHLVSVFTIAGKAARDPEGFRAMLASLSSDFEQNVAHAMAPLLELSNDELIRRWKATSAATVDALAALPDDQIVPWLVNDLPSAVLCMAGTTEAFAHGQDVRDAFDRRREPSPHVRSICEFAYHTRTFGYPGQGREIPEDTSLRFELTGPTGESWEIGDAGTANVVRGSAWDLALLVTRRRHPADLDLQAGNDHVRDWMSVAQAYRGSGGPGRQPLGQKVRS
ncbi:maleylpyruvate isomerase family mycothiol-dependent enzyme [Myceligenerans indicum]|uniref:Maleylpyruvate isomerase family mycothiol-dependent enzyme n=1 Tax=Myceligenerans indicum TaxID=2593663 RepID=A0ABS1LIF0_9MICO|nr:maleylpyruvate isomerase family mycothiol-dependent enzyme [Myceligenerans indicum]MBL0885603.1 maleylpyruvate isomerase family mycothiol-dependent enzyme [Myceligenerans indicum]